MTRRQVDKYLGKYVAVTFINDWFNEATQSWVHEDDEYEGILNRCSCPTQTQYYQLDNNIWLPTDNACWGAYRMKSIQELNPRIELTKKEFDLLKEVLKDE